MYVCMYACMVPLRRRCYVTLLSWKLDPHPPPRNANNIEHYTFITLFSGKSDTPHPHLHYVTLEWPLYVCMHVCMYGWMQRYKVMVGMPAMTLAHCQAYAWCTWFMNCHVILYNVTEANVNTQTCYTMGSFKCYVTLFFWKLAPHPPPRNANNIEPYTCVTLFPGKFDTTPPPSALRNT